jgi:hypothetical protein
MELNRSERLKAVAFAHDQVKNGSIWIRTNLEFKPAKKNNKPDKRSNRKKRQEEIAFAHDQVKNGSIWIRTNLEFKPVQN